jgi:two-component system NtrC family sensor kinase
MPQQDDNTTIERAAVEELLQRTQRLASIGTLAGGIAHEVKNLLGGILMAAQYAGSVLDREDGHAIVEKALADIETDAKRCDEIVRRLLRLAREEPGTRTDSDLKELIESAIGLARRSVAGPPPEILLETDDGLPPVRINAIEVHQALVNVLVNALRSGASRVRVRASEQTSDARLRVRIEDDGKGLPTGDLGNLLDPVEALDDREFEDRLGLSLVHAVVTDHGGSFDVASSPADGTTVTLELPLSPGAE